MDRELPYRRDHERSKDVTLRHPQTLRDYLRELREANEAEVVAKLHGGGGLSAPPERTGKGDPLSWNIQTASTHASHAIEPGSRGTPRWTHAFRAYITGADCDTSEDGEWRWPLRSSLFRLSIGRSGTDRLASAYVWLLPHHRYGVREAWAAQCGILADPAIADAAEAWAAEALRRWWACYVEQPRGRMIA